MGLQFLREHGARRADLGDIQADLFGDLNAPPEESAASDEAVNLGYEDKPHQWQPHSVSQAAVPADWRWRPIRFVDGKDVGRTAAWMRAPGGRATPIRVGQIGVISLGSTPGEGGHQLRTESCQVEKFVAFMADLFPWDEVESFAAALQAQGYRLLPVTAQLKHGESPHDYGRLRDSTKSASMNAMFRLERAALRYTHSGALPPTVLDGSLQSKGGDFAPSDAVTGVVKTHTIIPLHARGFQTLESLRFGDRTPVYGRVVKSEGDSPLYFLTWFLRLGPTGGETPDRGVVRVEINQTFFEEEIGKDYGYVDRLSRFLCLCRTRDSQYGRAATTLYPIQRAEDALRSRFAETETLLSRFFRMNGLYSSEGSASDISQI